MVSPEWWRTFYSGKYVDFHQDAIAAKDNAAEADWILKLLEPPPQGRILDVGCGEGRHSIELAARGYQMTAVDIAQPLLDIARQAAQNCQLSISFEQRDMRDLPWKSAFDAAFCVWGSFGVFDEVGNQQVVSAVYQALKPGGRFLIENHSLETLLPILQPKGWQRIGDHLIRLEEQHFDHATSRLESVWTFLDATKGHIETQSLSMRIYSYHELRQLLENAGFVEPQGYDTISRNPFGLGAQRLSLVAAKP